MKKKAELNLSLGFVVSVIFAVVLLVFGIAFLTGIFEDTDRIAKMLQQQAEKKLREELAKNNENFLIYPAEYTLKTGRIVVIGAGIKNTDNGRHQYVIGIRVEGVPIGASESEVAGWISYARSPKTVLPKDIGFIPLSITVPENAMKGTYIMRITACYEKNGIAPASDACDPNSPNIWSTSQDFLLNID